ncbi:MAG: penicillin-binding protein 2, partial [Proteobacteria bacterium]|nr:penicillin-binding protein 2 [Pseudomonadota bacterium]
AYFSRLLGKGMSMAGKTGTSQVRRITKEEREKGLPDPSERPWIERDHALFVGYGPVDAPRFALSVVVEHGGGGSSMAAPIGRDIMRKAIEEDPMAKPVEADLPEPGMKEAENG